MGCRRRLGPQFIQPWTHVLAMVPIELAPRGNQADRTIYLIIALLALPAVEDLFLGADQLPPARPTKTPQHC